MSRWPYTGSRQVQTPDVGASAVVIQGVDISIADVQIVRNATLEAAPGSIVGLIGPNGSGKTTLLRAVYRALRPRRGTVLVNGADVWSIGSLAAARSTAAVAQDERVDADFTVRDIVALGRLPHIAGSLARMRQRDWDVVDGALGRTDLEPFAGRQISTLSGGERQRVMIARALAQEPTLLVLDEPTNHLDIRYQLEVMGLVASLGVTTLVTLHDLGLAGGYCDRLYLMADGQVVASGTPSDVLTPEVIKPVYGVHVETRREALTGRLHVTCCLPDQVLQREPPT